MSQIKLSIIVPCYKVEKYLPDCLDSLLSQTLEDIELVCINDGSPDNCLKILQSYKERYNDRIVLIDKENEGVWKARIDGIAQAHGEYIGFADPDDSVAPEYARKLYEAAIKNNADVACCGYERMDENSQRVYSREMTRFGYRTFDIQREYGMMLEVNTAPWNKIFRSDILKNIRTLEHIPPALDDMLFAQLIYMDTGIITFIPDLLIKYRVRQDSIINTINNDLVPPIYDSMRELREIFSTDRSEMLPYIDALAFLHLGISLMYRLYTGTGSDFDNILDSNTRFLDECFPTWRKNPYIRLSYVLKHKGVGNKLWIISMIYRFRLFKLFLRAYTSMIRLFKIDIKW